MSFRNATPSSSRLSPITEVPDTALPQYGFGSDVSFENLLDANPFLFRIYTPKTDPSKPAQDPRGSNFIAQRFLNDPSLSLNDPRPPPPSSIYADVVQHMDWTTKSTSSYISTSFSFAWAIWEAVRRYHANMKHDIEIAVIDATAVADQAVTAISLLRKGTPKDRHPDHWKWYRFALESQSVLVHGSIPSKAIFASVPLLPLIDKLPSYLLKPGDATADKLSSFDRLGWDFHEKKPSFRQFCQGAVENFLHMPVGPRLRDATGSSIRLSLQFLRPWLQEVSPKDISRTRDTVLRLAVVVGRWPGQWWVREHEEVPELLESLVQVVLEEIQEARRAQKILDTSKAQVIVDQLRELSEDLQHGESSQKLRRLFDSLPVSPTLPESDSSARTIEDSAAAVSRATASCWLTGFLFGTFITFCLFSHHRRELLLVT